MYRKQEEKVDNKFIEVAGRKLRTLYADKSRVAYSMYPYQGEKVYNKHLS